MCLAYLKKFRKDAYLISLGVNAYLTLCPVSATPSKPLTPPPSARYYFALRPGSSVLKTDERMFETRLRQDHSPSDTGGSAGADRFEGATLCAGHRAEKRWGEPMKLLRRPSVGAAPAIFSMDEIHTPRFK